MTTNFPGPGDDMKVSLRNSEFRMFPVSYARNLRSDHPDVWSYGGGDDFARLVSIADKGGAPETVAEETAIRNRESWASRNASSFQLAATVSQIRNLVVGERGMSYMKNLVRAEIVRLDSSDGPRVDLRRKSNAKKAMAELRETTRKSLRRKAREHNGKHGDDPLKRLRTADYLAVSYHRGIDTYRKSSRRARISNAGRWAMGRVDRFLSVLRSGEYPESPFDTDLLPRNHPKYNSEKREEKMEEKKITLGDNFVCNSVETLENGAIRYSLTGRMRASFPINGIAVLSGDAYSSGDADSDAESRHIQKVTETDDSFLVEFAKKTPGKEEVVDELTSLNIADLEKRYKGAVEEEESEEEEPVQRAVIIEGIASSTSIDTHGTEMSVKALRKMGRQVEAGIPVLPSHASHHSAGIGEWDEVIGRTMGSEILPESNIKKPADSGENQFLMKVRSVLYRDEPKAQALLRRLNRGEPIGQSIGGWFENVEVIENDGKIERVIVQDVTLDHIAITRAPSNPDSINLMTLSVRNALEECVGERRDAVSATKMPLAPQDTPWDWSTEAANEILGDPPDWTRYRKAHLYAVKGEGEKKSGYKLPVARMFGSTLKIVYRGVVAAMAALNGARGGVDIPDSDRPKIYANIKRYYAMFDKDAPPLRSADEEQETVSAIDAVTESPSVEVSPLTETEESVNNKSQRETVVDTRSKTGNNEAVESLAEDSATTKSSGEDMTENDFAKFAELLNGAIAPLAERVAVLESAPEPETEKQEKVEVRTEESAEVTDLKKRLAKAENMITRVIETPIRRGSHRLSRHGVLAEDMYTRNAISAEKEGCTMLPRIVKRHAEKLSDDNNKLTKNQLVDMLTQGLRAAEMDGLLNHSTNSKLWQ
jgi:hypothetical protein